MSSILECDLLTKTYNTGKGIKDVTLCIDDGKTVGVLGPNGSGKSTLIKLITGMLTPTSGKILINGEKPGKESKKIISYLPERNCLSTWMRVSEVLEFYCDFYDDFDRDKALVLLDEMKINPKERVKTLSKGTQEKTQLIMSMSRKAKLYCLDEPIVGVDPAARENIVNTIINNRNKDAAVLISTHLISDVEKILDDVIFVQNGKILLIETVQNLWNAYKMSVDDIFRSMYR